MISSLAWIAAGVADPTPKRYEMSSTERELLKLMEENGADPAQLEAKLLGEIKEKHKSLSTKPKLEHSLPADLRMDEYSSDEEDEGMALGKLVLGNDIDSDQDDEDGDNGSVDSQEVPDANDNVGDGSDDDDDDDELADVPDTREFAPVNVDGLEAMRLSDPGGTGGVFNEAEDELDDEDLDDINLSPDDALIVVAKTEDDFASLEVNVYDQKTGNLFVHHDIPLPSYPLSLALGQVSSGGTTGNFCAVGTFSPGIEIWNLDVLNALEPSCILGGEDTSAADDLMKLQFLRAASGSQSKKLPKLSQGGLRPGSHTDAVLALSWNPIHRQVIASGSADCTVKLWDVTQAGSGSNEKCNAATFSHHKDKVQSVAWHPKEGTLLASGSFDRTVALLDARSHGENVKSVKITGDCEALAWDPFHSEYLTVASEDGVISCWDVRRFETSAPLWSFVANEYGGVTNLVYNQQLPGMMATVSTDATLTLWDTYAQNNAPAANVPPRVIVNKDMCVGKLYTVNFYPSTPWLVACGGSGNQLAIWDLSEETSIQKQFAADVRLGLFQGRESSAPNNAKPEAKPDDFEAMMTNNTTGADIDESRKESKANKKKGKGKKKVHRKGR